MQIARIAPEFQMFCSIYKVLSLHLIPSSPSCWWCCRSLPSFYCDPQTTLNDGDAAQTTRGIYCKPSMLASLAGDAVKAANFTKVYTFQVKNKNWIQTLEEDHHQSLSYSHKLLNTFNLVVAHKTNINHKYTEHKFKFHHKTYMTSFLAQWMNRQAAITDRIMTMSCNMKKMVLLGTSRGYTCHISSHSITLGRNGKPKSK